MARVFPEGRLVYGMQLPIQSQSTIYAEPWEVTAGAADLAAVARAADRAASATSPPVTTWRSRGTWPAP